MSLQTVRVIFRYRMGDIVEYEGARWKVVARRYQEGEVSRFLQYGLVPEPHYGGIFTSAMTWVYEPDIHEETP